MSQPVLHELKSLALNPVNSHPALPLVRDQTSSLKDLETSRCRLPGMLEDRRYLPGCHGATVEEDREQEGDANASLFHRKPTHTHTPNTKLQAAYQRADASIQQVLDLLAA